MDLPKEAKRAPPAPVWNQSFPSPTAPRLWDCKCVVESLHFFFFFSYAFHEPKLVSHETASTSAECSRDKPPFSFVRGQDSTLWDIVLVSPQGAICFCRHCSVPVPCENGSAETTVAERGQNLVAGLWGHTLGENSRGWMPQTSLELSTVSTVALTVFVFMCSNVTNTLKTQMHIKLHLMMQLMLTTKHNATRLAFPRMKHTTEISAKKSNIQAVDAQLATSDRWFSRRAICMRMYSILRFASLNIDVASCSIFLSRAAPLLYVSIMFSVPCFTCSSRPLNSYSVSTKNKRSK